MLQLHVPFNYKHRIIYKYEAPLLQKIKIRTKSYSNKAILLKGFIHSDNWFKNEVYGVGKYLFFILKNGNITAGLC